jgi:hypothetical protein
LAGALVEAGAAVAGAVGVAPDGDDGMVVAVACGSLGALCFCHASQRRSAEKEKTMRAMRRCVSIM